MNKFTDDEYTLGLSDIEKMRVKYRMFISFSNQLAAKAIVLEILYNSLDECRNPRSPGNKIEIEYDERIDTIKISDNGRGIPTDILETILTTLNSGSNIDSGSKNDLETDTLGRNGVGTIAMTALGETTEVTTYRGGTENKYKRLLFHEGRKVEEDIKPCDISKHGLVVYFKPSKEILGRTTKIVWDQVRDELINLQFLNKKKTKITSLYINKNGQSVKEDYKTQPFESILSLKNNKESIISDKILTYLEDRNIIEEIAGKKYKRFIAMDIAFAFTSNTINPYIDSFCNGNNTIDNGSHLNGVMEGLCRYFHHITKNSLTERDKLDIKWEDVKTGLSLVVALRTNMEDIFTNQTKHKVSNDDLEKLIRDKTIESLQFYFKNNPNQLKEAINIVKTNAKARREGDKARNAVVKGTITNWSSFKMKNYDPCTNKGKEYKELYIIEGDSAKGSLKLSRDPRFQALFAIRGVSANVFKLTMDQIIGPNGNKEFNDLVTVMGCNAGVKFDLSKLQFNKIIIASDADVDGLFIRSLLCSFFFKLFPEIIQDGRLFIAEPPLYKVDDKKHPFVINKDDYIRRYITAVTKEYKLGYIVPPKQGSDPVYEEMDKKQMFEILSSTSSYVDDIQLIAQHYKVNERLIEMIIEEWTGLIYDSYKNPINNSEIISKTNMDSLMKRVGQEFNELWYDKKDNLIKGVIDGKYQLMELTDGLLRKCLPLCDIMYYSGPYDDGVSMILKNIKTGTEHELSLLGILKILKKFQPYIRHQFKGLGENKDEDIKQIIMDPNTRNLIRVQISDIENDMKVFQILRGNSQLDGQNRKRMMQEFKITRDMIST